MNLVEIEDQLADMLGWSGKWIPPDRLSELVEMTRAGEPGVALEIFCTQLFECEAAIPKDLFEGLRHLSREMGIDEKYCEWLAPRVQEGVTTGDERS